MKPLQNRLERVRWVIPMTLIILGTGGLLTPVAWFFSLTSDEIAGRQASLMTSLTTFSGALNYGVAGLALVVLGNVVVRLQRIEERLRDHRNQFPVNK